MTGQSLSIEEQFAGKWLELLKEAAPQVVRIAYLWNPANHSSASSWKAMQGLASTIKVTLQSVELRDPKQIDEAFAATVGERGEGVSSIRIPSTAATKPRSSSSQRQTTCRPSTSGGGTSIQVA
jgi:hypothetical protein